MKRIKFFSCCWKATPTRAFNEFFTNFLISENSLKFANFICWGNEFSIYAHHQPSRCCSGRRDVTGWFGHNQTASRGVSSTTPKFFYYVRSLRRDEVQWMTLVLPASTINLTGPLRFIWIHIIKCTNILPKIKCVLHVQNNYSADGCLYTAVVCLMTVVAHLAGCPPFFGRVALVTDIGVLQMNTVGCCSY